MISSTPDETKAFGKELAEKLQRGSVVALHGDLGAGKTTMAKGLVSHLSGISEEQINSPTFLYMHSYEAGPCPVFHFDLYRLKDAESFIEWGFLDFLGTNEGICVIEWADRITQLLPNDTIYVQLKAIDEEKRIIEICQDRVSPLSCEK